MSMMDFSKLDRTKSIKVVEDIEEDDTEEIDESLNEIEQNVQLFNHITDEELYEDQEMPPMVYGERALYMEFFENEKAIVKFIKHAVRYARSAPEYRNYMEYLIENMDFDSCYFFSKLTLEESKIAGLEIHHYPFTIYDLCEIVTIKKLSKGERLTLFSVAHEVLRLHYQSKVGLVPLTKTLHEMAHDGQLYIPATAIYGKWINFINEYREYLQESHTEKLAKLHQDFLNHDINIERTVNNLSIIPQLWVSRDNDLSRLLSKYDPEQDDNEENEENYQDLEEIFEEDSD